MREFTYWQAVGLQLRIVGAPFVFMRIRWGGGAFNHQARASLPRKAANDERADTKS